MSIYMRWWFYYSVSTWWSTVNHGKERRNLLCTNMEESPKYIDKGKNDMEAWVYYVSFWKGIKVYVFAYMFLDKWYLYGRLSQKLVQMMLLGKWTRCQGTGVDGRFQKSRYLCSEELCSETELPPTLGLPPGQVPARCLDSEGKQSSPFPAQGSDIAPPMTWPSPRRPCAIWALLIPSLLPISHCGCKHSKEI